MATSPFMPSCENTRRHQAEGECVAPVDTENFSLVHTGHMHTYREIHIDYNILKNRRYYRVSNCSFPKYDFTKILWLYHSGLFCEKYSNEKRVLIQFPKEAVKMLLMISTVEVVSVCYRITLRLLVP